MDAACLDGAWLRELEALPEALVQRIERTDDPERLRTALR